jgi:hypothetical protein
MTITELIKELENARDVCGDVEVGIMCDDGDFADYHVEIDHDWHNGGDFPIIVCDEFV